MRPWGTTASKKKQTWCFYSINHDTGAGVIVGANEASVRELAEEMGVTPGYVSRENSEVCMTIRMSASEGGG